jgi:hypothetical protein
MIEIDFIDTLDDVEDENEDCPFDIRDIQEMAKGYIDLFFFDKKDENGKEVSIKSLYTPRNISLALNLNICNDMSKLYEAMKSKFNGSKRKGKIPVDVEYILNKLNLCSKRGIPKAYAMGIIAIYLEVFEGCKVEYEGT